MPHVVQEYSDPFDLRSNERLPARSPELLIFSRLCIAGSALAMLSMLNTQGSIPGGIPLPSPLSILNNSSHHGGSSQAYARSLQSMGFHQHDLPLPGNPDHSENSSSRQEIARQRFRILSRQLGEALKVYGFEEAILCLATMLIEVSALSDRLQTKAMNIIAVKADKIIGALVRFIEQEGFDPLPEHARTALAGILKQLNHPHAIQFEKAAA